LQKVKLKIDILLYYKVSCKWIDFTKQVSDKVNMTDILKGKCSKHYFRFL
jgi:hypothetical protein